MKHIRRRPMMDSLRKLQPHCALLTLGDASMVILATVLVEDMCTENPITETVNRLPEDYPPSLRLQETLMRHVFNNIDSLVIKNW